MPGMTRPLGLSCNGDRLAVADPERGTATVIDLARRRWSSIAVPSAGALVGVALWDDGSVVLVDAASATIYRAAAGKRRARVLFSGEPLVRPVAVRELDEGHALVVDSGGHQLYALNTRTSELVPLGPGRGSPGQGWNFPVDAAVDDAGAVVVCDALNESIQRLVDGALEVVVGETGGPLVRPKGVAIDELGRIHVVDAGMQHVVVYEKDGTLVGRYGQPDEGDGSLALPAGICVHGNYVFVADSLHGRVQVFLLVGTPAVNP